MPGDPPEAPDPYAVSAAQTQTNIQTAQQQAALNAVGQYNAYGSTDFLRDQNGDPYAQISNLNPALDALLGGREGIGLATTGAQGDLLNTLPTGPINAPAPNQVGDAAFAQQMGMLRPQFDLQNSNLNTNLTNRGIPVGSEAWNNATKAVQTNQDNAMNVAANSAQVSGANEQNVLFGQNVTQHQQPYNDLANLNNVNPSASILGSAPGAVALSPSAIAPTDLSKNVYQSYNDQLAAYNQQQQQMMGLGLGAATLGLSPGLGAAMGGPAGSSLLGFAASDKNLKEDRTPTNREGILMALKGLPVDDYRYKDSAQQQYGLPEHRTGPMAQDVQKIFPNASNGHMIDVADLAGKMMAAIQALENRTSHLAPSPKARAR